MQALHPDAAFIVNIGSWLNRTAQLGGRKVFVEGCQKKLDRIFSFLKLNPTLAWRGETMCPFNNVVCSDQIRSD